MPDEQPRRRIPGLGIAIAVAFLILPIAGVAWWLNRPKAGSAQSGPGLADLDVVCLGRVDGLTPIASLEPGSPGKGAAVFGAAGRSVREGDKPPRPDDGALRGKDGE